MNELPSGCYRFVFPALNAKLRYVLQNPTTLLPTTAFTLASPSQSCYPLTRWTSVVMVTKYDAKYIDLKLKFQFVLTLRYKH